MYDGSPAQGSAFYAAWCDEHSIDPQKGTDQAQFERGILADETVPGVSKLSRAVFNILDTESDHYLSEAQKGQYEWFFLVGASRFGSVGRLKSSSDVIQKITRVLICHLKHYFCYTCV